MVATMILPKTCCRKRKPKSKTNGMTTANDRPNSSTARLTSASANRVPVGDVSSTALSAAANSSSALCSVSLGHRKITPYVALYVYSQSPVQGLSSGELLALRSCADELRKDSDRGYP